MNGHALGDIADIIIVRARADRCIDVGIIDADGTDNFFGESVIGIEHFDFLIARVFEGDGAVADL